MTDEPAPGTVGAIATTYAGYCARVAGAITRQADAIETLIDIMELADAIHCYGFGRSGHAAASLALRLRHSQRVLPDVWSSAIRCGTRSSRASFLILFSREGRRFELEKLVGFARDNDLTCAFVTGEPRPARSSSRSRLLSVPGLFPPLSTVAGTSSWPPTFSRRPWSRASVSGGPSPLRTSIGITSTDRSDRRAPTLPRPADARSSPADPAQPGCFEEFSDRPPLR